MREKFLLLTRHCDQKAMVRLFERLQNIEAERDLDWIKVEAVKGGTRKATAKRGANKPKKKRKK